MPGTMACVLHAVIKQTYGKGNGDVSGDGSRMIRGGELKVAEAPFRADLEGSAEWT